MLGALHTIWNEQKLTRKHTKGLGTLPVFRKGIPSSLGHAANGGESFLDQSRLYYIATAHFGSAWP